MMTTLVTYLLTALTAGVCGGAAMEGVLWLIGRGGWAKADMLVALGSLLTKSRDNAWRVGAVLHLISAVGFAAVYTLLMLWLGFTKMPVSMMLGLGVGMVHGLLVSLMLVWVVAEQHPLEEFNEASLAIGLAHLVGHVAFGGVVGLVVGLSPL
ncbi:MAG: hypothetical protein HZA93_28765 [Verrucomicrobia bacterium]|nr:hypothetical protein [Verrucomicrobiota bacterium]